MKICVKFSGYFANYYDINKLSSTTSPLITPPGEKDPDDVVFEVEEPPSL